MIERTPAVFRYPGPTVHKMLGRRSEDFGLEGDPFADGRAVVEALALPSCLVRPLLCELTTVTLAGPDSDREEVVRRQFWRLSSSAVSALNLGRTSANAEERIADELSPSIIGAWFTDVLASAGEGGRALWNEFEIPVCAARLPAEIGDRIGASIVLAEDGGEIEAAVERDKEGAWASAQRYIADRPPLGVSFAIMPAALTLDIEVAWNVWWQDDGPGPALATWLADLAALGWS